LSRLSPVFGARIASSRSSDSASSLALGSRSEFEPAPSVRCRVVEPCIRALPTLPFPKERASGRLGQRSRRTARRDGEHCKRPAGVTDRLPRGAPPPLFKSHGVVRRRPSPSTASSPPSSSPAPLRRASRRSCREARPWTAPHEPPLRPGSEKPFPSVTVVPTLPCPPRRLRCFPFAPKSSRGVAPSRLDPGTPCFPTLLPTSRQTGPCEWAPGGPDARSTAPSHRPEGRHKGAHERRQDTESTTHTALPWGFFPYDVQRREQLLISGLPLPTTLRLQVFSTS
jgi:hypothetical protein